MEEIATLLRARRAELAAKIAQLGDHDPAATANLNFGKRIGDGTAYAVERLTGAYQARTLYETVQEIDRALARLEEGRYGRCAACGESIPAERLAVLPWAALCVPCSGSGRRREGSQG